MSVFALKDGLIAITFYLYMFDNVISKECNININSDSDIIICDNTCTECNIICHECNQKLRIYSGALATNITCIGKNACKNGIFYIGNTGFYPPLLTYHNFTQNNYSNFNLHCIGNSSCYHSTIYMIGYFIEGGNIITDNIISQNVLQNSEINIAIGVSQFFNVHCGSDNNNCFNTDYHCYSGKCICNGNCSILNIANAIQTVNPTKNPASMPTMDPYLPHNYSQHGTLILDNDINNDIAYDSNFGPNMAAIIFIGIIISILILLSCILLLLCLYMYKSKYEKERNEKKKLKSMVNSMQSFNIDVDILSFKNHAQSKLDDKSQKTNIKYSSVNNNETPKNIDDQKDNNESSIESIYNVPIKSKKITSNITDK